MTDEEFSERVDALKKIEMTMESGMAQTLLASEGNAGKFVFYLKNAFKWRDQPEAEKQININFGGYIPPEPDKKAAKKDDLTEDL